MPAAEQPRRMSYEGVLNKTTLLLAVAVISAVLTWLASPSMWMLIGAPAAIAALVLGLVLSFKKEPSVVLTLLFAVAEGAVAGALSAVLNVQTQGIVAYALIATVVTLVTVLALFRSGKLRMTGKMKQILAVATLAYLAFVVVNFALTLFGVMPGMGIRDIEVMGIPLGLPIGILAVLLAAACLVADFDNTKKGVEAGVENKYEWTASFSLLATLVWMYVEFLRIFHYISALAE